MPNYHDTNCIQINLNIMFGISEKHFDVDAKIFEQLFLKKNRNFIIVTI